MEATVIVARCQETAECFGIRAERRGRAWYFTWAFSIKEDLAKKEGYDRTEVSGNIHLEFEYPGCPHCGDSGFCQCYLCNKIFCLSHRKDWANCPHCGSSCRLGDRTSTFEGISGGEF